jgi:hypothetical protein
MKRLLFLLTLSTSGYLLGSTHHAQTTANSLNRANHLTLAQQCDTILLQNAPKRFKDDAIVADFIQRPDVPQTYIRSLSNSQILLQSPSPYNTVPIADENKFFTLVSHGCQAWRQKKIAEAAALLTQAWQSDVRDECIGSLAQQLNTPFWEEDALVIACQATDLLQDMNELIVSWQQKGIRIATGDQNDPILESARRSFGIVTIE